MLRPKLHLIEVLRFRPFSYKTTTPGVAAVSLVRQLVAAFPVLKVRSLSLSLSLQFVDRSLFWFTVLMVLMLLVLISQLCGLLL